MDYQNLPKRLKKRNTPGLISFLESKGCTVKGCGKHLKATHPDKLGAIIISNNHGKEIPKGTFHSILKAIKAWGFISILTIVLCYLIF